MMLAKEAMASAREKESKEEKRGRRLGWGWVGVQDFKTSAYKRRVVSGAAAKEM